MCASSAGARLRTMCLTCSTEQEGSKVIYVMSYWNQSFVVKTPLLG